MTDLLGIGQSGVLAYRSALAAIGDNVANAETPGYARRNVALKDPGLAGSGSPVYSESIQFNGVKAGSVERAWDEFRAADTRFAAGADGRAQARERWLSHLETALADGPTGIGNQLSTFFNAGTTLAANPSNSIARSAMLAALDGAASAIRTTADALGRAGEGIARAATIEAEALNADLSALAQVNVQLRQAAKGGVTRATLEDQRDRLIDSVAGRIDVSVATAADGQATLTLARAPGTILLDPAQRSTASVAIAADGRVALQLSRDGTTTPLPATGGTLAGLADIAAATADRRTEIDALAAGFAAAVNAWSANGRTDAGTAGPPLLTIGAGAATLALAAVTIADIAAASADGTANGNLLALPALRAGDGSAEARWALLVSQNAQTLAAARYEAAATSARKETSFADRDQVTGIDLDREAAELMRFQQAYNGAARIIQVARETTQAILDLF